MSRALQSVTVAAVSVVSAVAFTLAPAAAAEVDQDGDGVVAGDCAPLDPSVHPGAVDRPDPAFVDTNCDGIDGDAAKAVFVSLGGDDLAPGTLANPKRTITAAVAAAAAAGKDVYVAGGTYGESVPLASGVGIYGEYAPLTGVRSPDETTVIAGAPAALATGVTGVVLQLLTLHGQQDASGNSYGLRAVRSGSQPSQVALDHVVVNADAGRNGVNGSSGAGGPLGAGQPGGNGGAGGCGTGVAGLLGAPGSGNAQPGAAGATAANVPLVTPTDAPTWPVPSANPGLVGGPGGGGSGGTGGTGDSNFGSLLCGGLGGAGGRGGGGGAPGTGGAAGGGSFGVYAFDSSVVAMDSTITAANGGSGGSGGNGGFGGNGVGGQAGQPGQCLTIFVTVCAGNGGTGFPGAQGGRGGGGGGAPGGPSVAVFQGGPQSGYTPLGTTSLTRSLGGVGGLQGNSTGQRAATGQSADVLRTPTAPATATSDFDGDGINDTGDACPSVPRGSADANGDGCPEAPDTTITSGPADHAFLLTNAATLGLASTETGSTFTCSLDGGAGTACTSPRSLTGLSGRTHVLDVWATDGAGDADPSAATRTFTVPLSDRSLRHSTGWSLKTGSGYFLSKYSTSTKKGASLSTTVSGARQLVLVATKAPQQGKVSVFLGSTLLKTVSLASTTTQKKQLIPITTFASGTGGTVRVVVATTGKVVRVEGLGVATG